jgi:hypothetical protein
MSGQYLSCTTILRDGNILKDWKMLYMPEEMNRFHLDDVYNSVSNILYIHIITTYYINCTYSGCCTHERFT